MQSAYVVEAFGSPNSALLVSCPCRHFQARRSLASFFASRMTSVAPPVAIGWRQSGAGFSSLSQLPLPSQKSVVQGSSSPGHGLPASSNRQAASQQSPPALLPSSQSSSPSSMPLPQRLQPATQAS